jgi:hypothetical protein
VAVASIKKENEKTEAETSTPIKSESLCDPGANFPTSSTVVPVKELQDKTEKESQAKQEMKSNAVTLNKEEEEKTKKMREGEEKKMDREQGDKPSELDGNKSESAPVPEVQSSSPKSDQFERNETESMEVSSDVDAKDRQQKENDEKVSLMLYS